MNLLATLQSVLLVYVLAVLAHILMCRFGGGKHFMPRGVLLGIAATGALLIHQIARQQLDLLGLYLFLAGWFLYLMIFINLLNSVTLKMLAHLHAAPQGCLPIEAFSAVFNADDGLLTRLHMMQVNGLVDGHNDALQLTPKARTLLHIIGAIGRVFSLRIG
jgi:hypothetical protein